MNEGCKCKLMRTVSMDLGIVNDGCHSMYASVDVGTVNDGCHFMCASVNAARSWMQDMNEGRECCKDKVMERRPVLRQNNVVSYVQKWG